MTAPNPSAPNNRHRRRWPWVLAAFGAGLLVAGSAWIILQATIAGIVEKALRDYAARRGLSGLTLKVRQITPWHAEIQALAIGNGTKPEDRLRLDRLSVDYSPSSLKARKIKAVTLHGLYLQIENRADGWTLTGLPPQLRAPADPPDRAAAQRIEPHWMVAQLEIRNSRLEIHRNAQDLSVPFEFQAHAAGKAQDHYQGQLICHLGAQTIRTAFDLDLAQQHLTIEGAAQRLDLRRIGQILAPDGDLALQGRLAAVYQARLVVNPPSLETAAIELHLPGHIRLPPAVSLKALDPHKPLATVRFDRDRAWTLHAPGLALTTPDQLQITGWRGRLTTAAADKWHLQGQFNLARPPRTNVPTDKSAATRSNRLPITYRGEWTRQGPWTLALEGQGTPWALGLNPDRRTDGNAGSLHFVPHLSVRLSGQARHVHIEGRARLTDVRGTYPETTIRVPSMTLGAEGQGLWQHLKGRYELEADDLRLRIRRVVDTRVPHLAITGAFATENQGWHMAGQARMARAAVHLPDHQIRLEGLHLKVPFSWPYAPSTAGGTLRLAAARWKEMALGAVHGRIQQRARGAEVHITHDSRLLPGGKLEIDGRLDQDPATGQARLDFGYRFARPASPEDIDLGRLMTDLAGIHLNGQIAAEGRGTYRSGQMTAGLTINLAGGRLRLPEQKGGLEGLRGAIAFPDLLVMRTAPRQQFFFERAHIGDIAVTDGRFDFQIEPGGRFFLEQSQFKWCQGTVYLPAARIAPGDDNYEITLWCDRLKLAPLLEQLGAAQVEGGGTVSGRIPIGLRNGQILVDSGFLYSSPGEGGTIRLHGTDMLTAGISPGTPEHAQLELARQALKEYDYRWVKLSLATAPQEDLLRLKLQLDGKPSRPLPFIYDPRAGGFVPAGPDSKGSIFEGIRLDVNFSLPLNRLLEYKDLMKLFS